MNQAGRHAPSSIADGARAGDVAPPPLRLCGPPPLRLCPVPPRPAAARHRRRAALPSMGLALLALALAPAQGFARALVRVVHAVPSVGRAQVTVRAGARTTTLGSVGFGHATGWRAVRSGSLRWWLRDGPTTLATGTTRVGSGAYDLVALPRGRHVTLTAYRARAGRPGTALLRVIHAAPGLGSPQLRVDGHVAVGRLAYTQATPYVALAPGRHRLAADRPGDRTPFLARTVRVRAGVAYSIVVVGSDGRPLGALALADRTASPAPGPHRAASTPTAPARRMVLVRPGDSLWAIAQRLSGPRASDATVQRRLVAIWDANARRIGTGDPDLLYPGTRLRV